MLSSLMTFAALGVFAGILVRLREAWHSETLSFRCAHGWRVHHGAPYEFQV